MARHTAMWFEQKDLPAGEHSMEFAIKTTADFIADLRRKILRDHPDFKTVTPYRLALDLGVEWKTVKRWIDGQGSFSHALAVKIADKLGYAPEYVIACIELERAQGDTMMGRMWGRVAQAGWKGWQR